MQKDVRIRGDENVLHMTKQMTLRVEMLIDSMLPDKDITPSQSNILGYLFRHHGEEITATKIHKDMHLSRATISALLKKLRLKGYLSFGTAEGDDRLKNIALTEKALECRDRIDECFRYVEAQMFLGFSEEEKEESAMLLTRMLENLDRALEGMHRNPEKNHQSEEEEV